MQTTFSLFGYDFSISVVKNNPVARVMAIIDAEMQTKHSRIDTSLKIERIKILRRAEVSKILIDAGLVHPDDYRQETVLDKPYVGLRFAKEWIEAHYQ